MQPNERHNSQDESKTPPRHSTQAEDTRQSKNVRNSQGQDGDRKRRTSAGPDSSDDDDGSLKSGNSNKSKGKDDRALSKQDDALDDDPNKRASHVRFDRKSRKSGATGRKTEEDAHPILAPSASSWTTNSFVEMDNALDELTQQPHHAGQGKGKPATLNVGQDNHEHGHGHGHGHEHGHEHGHPHHPHHQDPHHHHHHKHHSATDLRSGAHKKENKSSPSLLSKYFKPTTLDEGTQAGIPSWDWLSRLEQMLIHFFLTIFESTDDQSHKLIMEMIPDEAGMQVEEIFQLLLKAEPEMYKDLGYLVKLAEDWLIHWKGNSEEKQKAVDFVRMYMQRVKSKNYYKLPIQVRLHKLGAFIAGLKNLGKDEDSLTISYPIEMKKAPPVPAVRLMSPRVKPATHFSRVVANILCNRPCNDPLPFGSVYADKLGQKTFKNTLHGDKEFKTYTEQKYGDLFQMTDVFGQTTPSTWHFPQPDDAGDCDRNQCVENRSCWLPVYDRSYVAKLRDDDGCALLAQEDYERGRRSKFCPAGVRMDGSCKNSRNMPDQTKSKKLYDWVRGADGKVHRRVVGSCTELGATSSADSVLRKGKKGRGLKMPGYSARALSDSRLASGRTTARQEKKGGLKKGYNVQAYRFDNVSIDGSGDSGPDDDRSPRNKKRKDGRGREDERNRKRKPEASRVTLLARQRSKMKSVVPGANSRERALGYHMAEKESKRYYKEDHLHKRRTKEHGGLHPAPGDGGGGRGQRGNDERGGGRYRERGGERGGYGQGGGRDPRQGAGGNYRDDDDRGGGGNRGGDRGGGGNRGGDRGGYGQGGGRDQRQGAGGNYRDDDRGGGGNRGGDRGGYGQGGGGRDQRQGAGGNYRDDDDRGGGGNRGGERGGYGQGGGAERERQGAGGNYRNDGRGGGGGNRGGDRGGYGPGGGRGGRGGNYREDGGGGGREQGGDRGGNSRIGGVGSRDREEGGGNSRIGGVGSRDREDGGGYSRVGGVGGRDREDGGAYSRVGGVGSRDREGDGGGYSRGGGRDRDGRGIDEDRDRNRGGGTVAPSKNLPSASSRTQLGVGYNSKSYTTQPTAPSKPFQVHPATRSVHDLHRHRDVHTGKDRPKSDSKDSPRSFKYGGDGGGGGRASIKSNPRQGRLSKQQAKRGQFTVNQAQQEWDGEGYGDYVRDREYSNYTDEELKAGNEEMMIVNQCWERASKVLKKPNKALVVPPPENLMLYLEKKYPKAQWGKGNPIAARNYPNGTTFVAQYANGGSRVYYPHEGLAVAISGASPATSQILIVRDPSDNVFFFDKALLAELNSSGRGTIYGEDGVVKAQYSTIGGFKMEHGLENSRRWHWNQGGQRLVMKLNKFLSIRMSDFDKIFLNFYGNRRGFLINVASGQEIALMNLENQIDPGMMELRNLIRPKTSEDPFDYSKGRFTPRPTLGFVDSERHFFSGGGGDVGGGGDSENGERMVVPIYNNPFANPDKMSPRQFDNVRNPFLTRMNDNLSLKFDRSNSQGGQFTFQDNKPITIYV